MGIRFAAVLLCLALAPALARAEDYGPRRDVAQVRSDARRLLAHRVRLSGVDPAAVTISDVVVVKDQALLSWDSGKQHGLMGLVRYLDRWWDALDKLSYGGVCYANTIAYPLKGDDGAFSPASTDALTAEGLARDLATDAAEYDPDVAHSNSAAAAWKTNHNKPGHVYHPMCGFDGAVYDVRYPIQPQGGRDDPDRAQTSGYDLSITYARNDAPPGLQFARIYGRAPTAGEMLSNPPPPKELGGTTDVFLFDLTAGGTKPVTFASGTKIDVWFPFVLDDSLHYRMSFFAGGKMSPMIPGTLYDNVLSFNLPAFTIPPGDALMGDVEGWW